MQRNGGYRNWLRDLDHILILGLNQKSSEGTKYIVEMDFNPSFAIRTQSCHFDGGEIFASSSTI
ncbi:hypothetical protein [Flavobacterium sp. JAS]|uniref:hypothetical protein n=1 Tax=Flavobacterium sp. JAS TaxID=2897329 RepID=UPI001E5CFD16|nr:hypothetical protein [Flavobacterium sp. JAS]MCD0470370.1 hypothetical protein [Flavobacterium sp. JAS]